MTALSLTPNVREHRFQMHHYRTCAGDPLSRGFERRIQPVIATSNASASFSAGFINCKV
jgi:hypothetical protein